LKTKQLTWDYLSSDNFLQLACHSKVPVCDLLRLVRDELLPSAVKPNMCALIERVSEEFWRVRCLSSEPLFDPAVARLLYRLGVTPPLVGRGERTKLNHHLFNHLSLEHNHDDLRAYTHASLSATAQLSCGCFHCLVEPFMEAKRAELWEGEGQALFSPLAYHLNICSIP
jgi:hypothetical protein